MVKQDEVVEDETWDVTNRNPSSSKTAKKKFAFPPFIRISQKVLEDLKIHKKILEDIRRYYNINCLILRGVGAGRL